MISLFGCWNSSWEGLRQVLRGVCVLVFFRFTICHEMVWRLGCDRLRVIIFGKAHSFHVLYITSESRSSSSAWPCHHHVYLGLHFWLYLKKRASMEDGHSELLRVSRSGSLCCLGTQVTQNLQVIWNFLK
ncbi:hypothetical protein KC19_2G088900 [Ceratodon purpureus]|uniref:Uncharacterized protein n=1 Tax=Ceratodon purpureus TaxID=3225 RepID=A0A8T0IRR0_CERPU|nr:hypothetical protein KC19_2G088900 [Ceratodon purpureus]